MNKGTYIYLDRGILDHWTYKDKPFNRSMAWIDMLLIADHTTHTKLWRGKPTEYKRGDVNVSITELAKRWGWSRDKARRFISHLEQDNMVRVNSTTYRTTITIVKYDDFQIKRARDKARDKTTDRASNKATDKAYLSNKKVMQKEIQVKGAAPNPSGLAAPEEEETVGLTKEEWDALGDDI